ncbi:MBL fold metallo-hydrolase [Pseudoalteromonas sp. Of7M-16]|uniref:MBL fold metallo-hydrolase n=1 Tax=Pseudoalteromonas sp. Of7M-16 TaxID=2917756 RepID=UPI001EF3DD4A|nr:MBL fold metallo-hydrolase [Pseudoalteromonas sp. Of7M-16]MCG7551068.1 MBL fold metallo-hydrolase [Pseudoalteromonas sp. Of7M-16]
MINKYLPLPMCILLASCTTPNNVNRLAPSQEIKYKSTEGYTHQFANSYNMPKAYPHTCEEDCYPKSPYIECQNDMETCQYIGKNPALSIDEERTFDVKWLGHASFSVTTPTGETILIDPVTGQFDWPVDWAFVHLAGGFYRNEPTAYQKQTLNDAKAVVYSHIHYDHFSKSDIEKIGNQPTYLTPLNFADYFPTGGYNIVEMPWYTQYGVGKTDVHFVPAHHFSNRLVVPMITNDDDETLWGGWVFKSADRQLFFAGDTGYSGHFKDIHAQYGDMDVCLIPIASYHHETHGKWYRNVHLTPEDALLAAKELNCGVMIPWGHGNMSWKMGDHTSHSALFRLLHMKNQLKSTTPLYILNEGEQVKL